MQLQDLNALLERYSDSLGPKADQGLPGEVFSALLAYARLLERMGANIESLEAEQSIAGRFLAQHIRDLMTDRHLARKA